MKHFPRGPQRPAHRVFFLIFGFALFASNLWAGDAASDSYEKGIRLHEAGLLEEAIKAFEKAASKDRGFAQAFHQLALCYSELATPHSRMKATQALRRAIRIDPENIQYLLDMAKLALKKEMRGEANAYFKRVLERDPLNAEAHFRLGLWEEQNMLWFKDLVNPHEHVLIRFEDHAGDRTAKAKYHFRQAVTGDPQFKLPYYHLAFIYYELAQYDSLAFFLEEALLRHPAENNFYLFRGLAYHKKNMFLTAQKSFEKALELMTDEESAALESLIPVLSPQASATYAAMDAAAKRDYRQSFWKQRDPLLLTEFNERLLEHYTRVAYVNMRFGDIEAGKNGWDTDQGQTYLRFGTPLLKYRTRPSADGGFQDASISNPRPWLNSSKEYWEYGDFKFTFEDEFVRREFKFKRSFQPEQDSKLSFERMIETRPEIYDDDLGRTRLKIRYHITQFRGKDGLTRIELFYGLTPNQITLFQYDAIIRVKVRQGFLLFDKNWHELSRDVRLSNRTLANVLDSQGKPVKLDRLSTEAPPGRYNMAFEILDEDSRNFSSVKDSLVVRDFRAGELVLSDVLLASSIRPDSAQGVYTFPGNISVTPSLTASFAVDSLIFTYFEVYNLALDAQGASRFDIETTIVPDTKQGGLAAFAASISSIFGSSRSTAGQVSVTNEYFGNATAEPLYNAFQMNEAAPGAYRLTIKVTDRNNNAVAEQRLNVTLY